MPSAADRPRTPQTPLRVATPRCWAQLALADPVALLHDHAHLERKAASNALELLGRWPFPVDLRAGEGPAAGADRWMMALSAVARDEVRHLVQVLRLLTRRGGHMERSHASPYAAALRAGVRLGRGRAELLDRLLVSALIEARSAERFELLAAAARDPELARFYASLLDSERGHYRIFLELARLLPPGGEDVEARWSTWLEAEARIVASMPCGPLVHGWVAPARPRGS